MRPLFAAGWVLFVLGGLTVGWMGLSNVARLEQRPALPSWPSLAPHPPLRDFDQEPPPFAAAGEDEPDQTASPAGRLTILLMGIDQRPDEAAEQNGDPGRTDSLLLVSIDYDARTAVMASIPRDSFVVIPGHGNERVNAAYTLGELAQRGGGPALAKRTVAQVFGVPVDRYALVDIPSAERLIDTLGGVWIDNPFRLVDREYPTEDYGVMTIDIPAGRQLMSGAVAVQYARTRHPDSDYGRQARQQQVLLALRDQALQLDIVPRLPALLPDLLRLVRTDLSPVEILQLARFGRGLDRERDVVALPPDPELTPAYAGQGGANYIKLTPAYRVAVRRLVTQPRLAAERARITVLNAGAPVGSGGAVQELLGRAGLAVSDVTTAPPTPTTRIEAGPAVRLSAETVARTLGVPANSLVTTNEPGQDVRVLLGPDLRLPRATPSPAPTR